MQKVLLCPLHCIASYPANIIDSNLGYIDYLEKSSIQKLDFRSLPWCSCLLPCDTKKVPYIEKHFTINKSLSGGDNSISSNHNELSEIITFRNNYKKIFFLIQREKLV